MKKTDLGRIVEDSEEVQYEEMKNKLRNNGKHNSIPIKSRQITYEDQQILDIIRNRPFQQLNYSSELGPEDFLDSSKMDLYRDRVYK